MGWNGGVDYVQDSGWYRPKPAGGGGGGAWASLIPQTSLVNAWTFNNASSVSDAVGGKTLTGANVSLLGSGPTSSLTNAASFNGTTSKYDSTSFANPFNFAAFTFVIWINFTTLPGGVTYAANDNPGTTGVRFNQGSGHPVLAMGNGTLSQSAGATILNISTATWTMLTFAVDATSVDVYAGSSFNSAITTTAPPPLAAGSANFGFGYNPSYSGDWLTGSIAAAAIYSRKFNSTDVSTILAV